MKNTDEVKKGLECCAASYADCHKECPYKPDCDGSQILKDTLALTQQLEDQIPKWISVYEHLPAVGQKVIARGRRGGIQAGVFRGSSSNHPETWSWKNRSTLTVYHWMPQSKLPKP